MKYVTIKALLLAVALILVMGTTAKADVVVTQFEWDRTGAEALPCAGDARWTLAPGTGVIDATVGINDADGVADGHAWTMLKDWETETFYITTTDPVAPTDEVLLAYTGEATAPPVLALDGCTPAEVIPPTGGGGGSTTPPAPTPTQQTTWDIGFKVTTIRPTNVLAKWRLVCSDGQITVAAKGKVRARTPLVRHLAPSIEGATSCHLRVRAYDIKPHVRPHNWPAPKVTTWVNVS